MHSSRWGFWAALLGALLAILGCSQADTAATPTTVTTLEEASTTSSLPDGDRAKSITAVGTAVWEMTDSTYPARRARHALAYDSARGKVVLFGGESANGIHLNDTWEWDGMTWTKLNPTTSPPPRQSHSLVYDGARARCCSSAGMVAPVA